MGVAAAICCCMTGAVRADGLARPAPPQNLQLLAQAYPRTGQNWQEDEGQSGGSGEFQTTGSGKPTKFNKASDLVGMEVYNPQDQKLGDVKDVVFDLHDGRISYIVLACGGTLGFNQKDLAVPPSAFQLSANRDHLVLNATKQNIEQARSIADNWPDVKNPSFGAMPFWQQNTTQTNLMNNGSTSH